MGISAAEFFLCSVATRIIPSAVPRTLTLIVFSCPEKAKYLNHATLPSVMLAIY